MLLKTNIVQTQQVKFNQNEKYIIISNRVAGVFNIISYDSKTRTLYVPSFGTNRIIAYKVK